MAKKRVIKKVTPKKPAPKKKTVVTKKAVPKKRVTKKTVTKKNVVAKKVVIKKKTTSSRRPVKKTSVTEAKHDKVPVKTVKKPKNVKNFVKISTTSKHSKFVDAGKRVQAGELQWSRYVVEGNVSYHYYLILK